MGARRSFVVNRNIRLHHVAGVIHEIAVLGRDVVDIFLDNRELTGRRDKSFAPSGELRDADEQSALVKIGALLSETDFHRRFSSNSIAVPV